MKIGAVDVCGGLRGIYAAGVFDNCMDRGIKFDLGIRVSAGSANLASYAAGQRGRNYVFYTEYAFRSRYMSLSNFILKRSFIDLDYVYGALSRADGENPLDYPALRDNPMELYIVAEEAVSGRTKYFDKSDIRQDEYDVMKASSAIPFVCRPYVIGGISYYDGALADPVPVQKAFELGCERVVLILTKPESEIHSPEKDEKAAARIQKKYPKSAQNLRLRAQRYNESVALAQRYAEQGRALIISPDDTCGVDTLKKDRQSLHRLYQKGYGDAAAIEKFINS